MPKVARTTPSADGGVSTEYPYYISRVRRRDPLSKSRKTISRLDNFDAINTFWEHPRY